MPLNLTLLLCSKSHSSRITVSLLPFAKKVKNAVLSISETPESKPCRNGICRVCRSSKIQTLKDFIVGLRTSTLSRNHPINIMNKCIHTIFNNYTFVFSSTTVGQSCLCLIWRSCRLAVTSLNPKVNRFAFLDSPRQYDH